MMRSSSATRSSREVCENVSNAARAAFTAASTSSAVPSRILPTACSVAGLMTSSSRRPAGLTHAPSMKNCLKSYMRILRSGRRMILQRRRQRRTSVCCSDSSNSMSATLARLKSPGIECFSNRRGGREVDGLLRIETADQAMQDAGGESVARADAIDDAVERVGAGRVGVPPAPQSNPRAAARPRSVARGSCTR